jgi:hypothetical protein
MIRVGLNEWTREESREKPGLDDVNARASWGAAVLRPYTEGVAHGFVGWGVG